MSALLLRRFRDAYSAFTTGHSCRDLRRAKIMRIRLLTSRHIRFHQAKAYSAEQNCDILSGGISHCDHLLANTLIGSLQRVTNRTDSSAYRVLLGQIEFNRYQLYTSRISERVDLSTLDSNPHLLNGCTESFVISPASKQYGKLFKGLGESGIFNALNDQFGFNIWYRHFVTSPLGWLRFALLKRFGRKGACTPP